MKSNIHNFWFQQSLTERQCIALAYQIYPLGRRDQPVGKVMMVRKHIIYPDESGKYIHITLNSTLPERYLGYKFKDLLNVIDSFKHEIDKTISEKGNILRLIYTLKSLNDKMVFYLGIPETNQYYWNIQNNYTNGWLVCRLLNRNPMYQ
ncbi:MAG: hypothetical protein ACOX6Q_03815 [Candidatus Dojkabacteria bacterium]